MELRQYYNKKRLINKIKIKHFSKEDSHKIIKSVIDNNQDISFIFNDKGKKYGLNRFLNTFEIADDVEALGYLEDDSGGYNCEDLSVDKIIEYMDGGHHSRELVLSIFLPIVVKQD